MYYTYTGNSDGKTTRRRRFVLRGKTCINCIYYSAYYKQYSSGFGKLNDGICSKYNKVQTKYETCKSFRNDEPDEVIMEERRIIALEQALESICEIAQNIKGNRKR